MKKKILSILLIGAGIFIIIVGCMLYKQNKLSYEKNFFSYAFMVDSKIESCLPQRVQWGMGIQEVLEKENISQEDLNKEEGFALQKVTYTNVSEDISEIEFWKKFGFDEEEKLVFVQYYIIVDKADTDLLCEKLYEQAKDCMPQPQNFSLENMKLGQDCGWRGQDSDVSFTVSQTDDPNKTAVIIGIYDTIADTTHSG